MARAQSRLLGFGTFEPCHALHCQVHGLYCQVLTADSLLWSRAAPSPQMRERAGATHWRQRALLKVSADPVEQLSRRGQFQAARQDHDRL
jgi:nicotinic acid mononucleotide adenylyltransferase